MKYPRKTLAAVALFGLAPLIGCDQAGVDDASTPDDVTPGDTTREPDTTQTPDREPPPAEPTDPGGIEDQSTGG